MGIGAGFRHHKGTNRSGRSERIFAPEIAYRSFGVRGEADDLEMKYVEHQFTLPMNWQRRWMPESDGMRPTFTYGPQLGFALATNFELTYDGETYTYEGYSYGAMGQLFKLDLGFNLGTGVTIPMPAGELDLSIRFYQGLAPRLQMGIATNRQVGLFAGWYF